MTCSHAFVSVTCYAGFGVFGNIKTLGLLLALNTTRLLWQLMQVEGAGV